MDAPALGVPQVLHLGCLACLTPIPALPRTDLGTQQTWPREALGAGAKTRPAAAAPPDLCLNQPGKRKAVRSGEVQASFNWRTRGFILVQW